MLRPYTELKANFAAFSTHSATLDALVPALQRSSRFVLLILADTTAENGARLVDWADSVLQAGACYVCCWGPDCGRLESCFDEAHVIRGLPSSEHDVIMTTSHASEPLEEAAWFALHAAWPTDEYARTCDAVILATIGNEAWAQQLRAYLEAGAPDPDAA
jgi:hypothetical protein